MEPFARSVTIPQGINILARVFRPKTEYVILLPTRLHYFLHPDFHSSPILYKSKSFSFYRHCLPSRRILFFRELYWKPLLLQRDWKELFSFNSSQKMIRRVSTDHCLSCTSCTYTTKHFSLSWVTLPHP